MDVEVIDYQESWKEEYEKEVEILKSILKDDLLKSFHIGSTSIEGLRAKPIIDVLVIVKEIEDLGQYTTEFTNAGYEVLGEFGIKGRRYFRKGRNKRTHHIHVYQYDNIAEIERHIIFRDYLSLNKERRQQYSALKSHLASQFPTNPSRYQAGKDSLVRDIEKEALAWYWTIR